MKSALRGDDRRANSARTIAPTALYAKNAVEINVPTSNLRPLAAASAIRFVKAWSIPMFASVRYVAIVVITSHSPKSCGPRKRV